MNNSDPNTSTTPFTQAVPIPPATETFVPGQTGTQVTFGSFTPKKRFGGIKTISAVLGIFLLVGGVATGVLLFMQPQLFEQRAAEVAYVPNCPAGEEIHCTGGDACTGYECKDQDWINNVCRDQGRSWCKNMHGVGMTCCVPGYVCASDVYGPGSDGCVPGNNPPPNNPPRSPTPPSQPTPTPTRTPTPSPTNRPGGSPSPSPTKSPSPSPSPTLPPGISAVCGASSVYSLSWNPLTQQELSGLSSGSQVYFCVNGTAASGTFQKARFVVNAALRQEVTLKRPNSNDFCDLYTIPANTYQFNVRGEIYHSSLGWVN